MTPQRQAAVRASLMAAIQAEALNDCATAAEVRRLRMAYDCADRVACKASSLALQTMVARLRARLLQELRAICPHHAVLEMECGILYRICVDCGAEERGLYTAFEVLTHGYDRGPRPARGLHPRDRALKTINDRNLFRSHRLLDTPYLVGRSAR